MKASKTTMKFATVALLALAGIRSSEAQISAQPGPLDLAGRRFAVAGYKIDGTLDSTFGNNGKLIVLFPGTTGQGKVGMALDSQNRIVLAGSVDDKIGIARYLPNGTPDTTFNGTGKRITNFGTGHTMSGHAVAVDQYDRIWVAVLESNQTWALGRLQASGAVDLTFGANGVVHGGDVQPVEPSSLLVDPIRGAFLPLMVIPNPDLYRDMRYVRVNASGNTVEYSSLLHQDLDNLAITGKVDHGAWIDEPNGIAIDTSGRISLVGTERMTGNPFWRAARWNWDGKSLDMSLQPLGQTGGTFSGLALDDRGNAMKIDDGGNMIFGGMSATPNYRFGLSRRSSTGFPDAAFGNNGNVTTAIPGTYGSGVLALALQGDKIIAGGFGWTEQNTMRTAFALVRYKGDGTLDPTFNGNGTAVLQMSCKGDSRIDALAIQNFAIGRTGLMMMRLIAAGEAAHDPCSF